MAGINSGRFVIVVTAVGANMGVDANEMAAIAEDIVGVHSDDWCTTSHHRSQ